MSNHNTVYFSVKPSRKWDIPTWVICSNNIPLNSVDWVSTETTLCNLLRYYFSSLVNMGQIFWPAVWWVYMHVMGCMALWTGVLACSQTVFFSNAERKSCRHLTISFWQICQHVSLSCGWCELTLRRDRKSDRKKTWLYFHQVEKSTYIFYRSVTLSFSFIRFSRCKETDSSSRWNFVWAGNQDKWEFQ